MPIELDQPPKPHPVRVTNPIHDPEAIKNLGPSTGRPVPPEGWWETIAEWTDGKNVHEKIQIMHINGGRLVRSLLLWQDRGNNVCRAEGMTFIPDSKGK
jgi:hypothetical protein